MSRAPGDPELAAKWAANAVLKAFWKTARPPSEGALASSQALNSMDSEFKYTMAEVHGSRTHPRPGT